jgi:hypothetical protein
LCIDIPELLVRRELKEYLRVCTHGERVNTFGLPIWKGWLKIYHFLLQDAEAEGADRIVGLYAAAIVHNDGYQLVCVVYAGYNGIEHETRIVVF